MGLPASIDARRWSDTIGSAVVNVSELAVDVRIRLPW